MPMASAQARHLGLVPDEPEVDEAQTGEFTRLGTEDPVIEDDPPFDWHSDPDVVVPPRRALAVYRNGAGDITIRQEALPEDAEDTFVVVPWDRAPDVARKIMAVLKEAGADG